MGFELYATRGRLVFEGTRYAGAEVEVRLDMPLADYLVHDALDEEEPRLRWFGEHALVSWNLKRDGAPVPATAEELLAMPRQFSGRLHREWLRLVSDPGLPFAAPSPDGGT